MAEATGFAANAVTFAATTATVALTAASPASSRPLLPQRHRCHHTEAHRRGRRRCLQGRAAAEKAKEALAPALRTIGQDGFTDLGNIHTRVRSGAGLHACGAQACWAGFTCWASGASGACSTSCCRVCRRPCPAPAPPAPLLYLLPPQAPLAPYVL